jgi:hypothetical protein
VQLPLGHVAWPMLYAYRFRPQPCCCTPSSKTRPPPLYLSLPGRGCGGGSMWQSIGLMTVNGCQVSIAGIRGHHLQHVLHQGASTDLADRTVCKTPMPALLATDTWQQVAVFSDCATALLLQHVGTSTVWLTRHTLSQQAPGAAQSARSDAAGHRCWPIPLASSAT